MENKEKYSLKEALAIIAKHMKDLTNTNKSKSVDVRKTSESGISEARESQGNAASERAQSESAKHINTKGTSKNPTDHEYAAKLHTSAAKTWRSIKSPKSNDMANFHDDQAKMHSEQAKK